jgi:hypothetical protein
MLKMDTIWHYTTQEAAFKIISDMKLRLTRQDFMDDFNEFRYLQNSASKIPDDHPHSKTAHEYSKDQDNWDRFMRPNRTFLGCFSKNDDDIALWERYGGASKGVAIGFDSRAIVVEDVRYESDESSVKLIESFLDKYEDDNVGFHNAIRPINEVTKQIHYESENELRVRKYVSDLSQQLFFYKESTICPFINMDIPEQSITEIKLGPRARTNAEFAWRDFLDPDFFENNANISRDWSDRTLDKVTIKISKSACKLY